MFVINISSVSWNISDFLQFELNTKYRWKALKIETELVKVLVCKLEFSAVEI